MSNQSCLIRYVKKFVLNIRLDYQGFFGLTTLDKLSWIRLSDTLLPRFARENPNDFYPATAVHQ